MTTESLCRLRTLLFVLLSVYNTIVYTAVRRHSVCYGVRSNETAAVIFPKLLYSATAERASELMHLVGRYSQDSEKLRSRIIQIVTVHDIDIFRRPFTKTKKRNKKYEFNGRYLRFFFFFLSIKTI